MPELKQIECSPECGFMVRSHDESEVMSMASKHIHKTHPDMDMSQDDIKARMTTA